MYTNRNKQLFPSRILSPQEKLDAIRRVQKGETKAFVARQIGVPESTLRGWCKNEGKILNLSRQLTPEKDEIYEPKNKVQKLEDSPREAYFSAKNYSSYSTDAMSVGTTNVADLSPNASTNLTRSYESDNLPEREKNRLELKRLSEELGLNTPEFDSTNKMLLAQWNVLLLQQQLKYYQANKFNTLNGGQSAMPSILNQQAMMKDNYLPWLKYQQSTSILNQAHTNGVYSSPVKASPEQNASLWKWYNEISTGQQNKSILFQQLLKEMPHDKMASEQNSENVCSSDNNSKAHDKTGMKSRAALDNLFFNTDNLPAVHEETEENLDKFEAIKHGEKFLKWLESCSDPSVTTVQLMHFEALLGNLKNGIDRKNCDLSKTKVKRK